MYQLQDPDEYQRRHILVVGGGDSAVEAALSLGAGGNRVILAYRKDRFFRVKQRNQEKLTRAQQDKTVTVLTNTTVTQIANQSATLKTPDGLREVMADFVFVFAGGIPPFQMLREAGVTFGEAESSEEEAA